MDRQGTLFLLAALLLGGDVTAAEQAAPTDETVLRLTAGEFSEILGGNPATADVRLAGRTVEVTGKVQDITRIPVYQETPTRQVEQNAFGKGRYQIHLGAANFRVESSRQLQVAKLQLGETATLRARVPESLETQNNLPLVLSAATVVHSGTVKTVRSDPPAVANPPAPSRFPLVPAGYISAPPQLWEYKLVSIPFEPKNTKRAIETLSHHMNQMGGEGWQYVERVPELSVEKDGKSSLCVLFMREKAPQSAAAPAPRPMAPPRSESLAPPRPDLPPPVVPVPGRDPISPPHPTLTPAPPGPAQPPFAPPSPAPPPPAPPPAVPPIPNASVPSPARIGTIIIQGNANTLNWAILKQLHLCPGQVLFLKDLEASEKRLRSQNVRSSISVLDFDSATEFKDILIDIQER